MRAVCAWCDADLGEREPLDDPSITHGICADCKSLIEENVMDDEPEGGDR
jgi:transcription initiation factor TFIIIB Brf1 subunit/transcription initiation factor TFIIB